MRKAVVMLMPVVLGAGSLAGCSGNPISLAGSAGKAAFKTVRGAEADATPIRLSNREALAPYKTLQVGEISTDVPPICTPQVIAKVREGVREGVRDGDFRKTFPGGGKTVRADIVCRFYKEKGMIGGEGRLDWLVTLVDVESGENIGVIFIEGVSGSPLQHGCSDMAKENTRELAKYLRRYQRKD